MDLYSSTFQGRKSSSVADLTSGTAVILEIVQAQRRNRVRFMPTGRRLTFTGDTWWRVARLAWFGPRRNMVWQFNLNLPNRAQKPITEGSGTHGVLNHLTKGIRAASLQRRNTPSSLMVVGRVRTCFPAMLNFCSILERRARDLPLGIHSQK